jgi:hypothetical protein
MEELLLDLLRDRPAMREIFPDPLMVVLKLRACVHVAAQFHVANAYAAGFWPLDGLVDASMTTKTTTPLQATNDATARSPRVGILRRKIDPFVVIVVLCRKFGIPRMITVVGLLGWTAAAVLGGFRGTTTAMKVGLAATAWEEETSDLSPVARTRTTLPLQIILLSEGRSGSSESKIFSKFDVDRLLRCSNS